ncbi:putative pilus assembly protein FilE [Acinetobacter sp. ANC 4805]|uniref:putative pilus assembly protein FilE n=1 Tax=Acinetobacter sp. ANC 4805 TaxID=2923425 RepID=UPI001F4A5463|nr:putative pilus assembly protein FilE [Acinetobacter sp. ANC 4805]MCH7312396.1 putative pilus assembly protein FilE [Acinetobacter sp. ANC 4805]
MLKKVIRKQPILVISFVCAVIASSSVVYAEGFYTIIGPDGRPMIVPRKSTEAEKKIIKSIPSNHIDDSIKLENRVQPKNDIDVPKTSTTVVVKDDLINASQIQPTIESKKEVIKSEVRSEPQAIVKSKNIILQQQNLEQKSLEQPKSDITKEVVSKEVQAVTTPSAFARVDGVEYVNNEYLEDQEFNLDGKKRFYTMPDGTGRLETIERKKGVSRSMLDRMLSRSTQGLDSIALSNSYVRLSAQDLSLAFENDRCFLEGYSKNKTIKTLAPQKDIGLWPRKPLKEKFEYELVQLEQNIQYMQVDSYASNANRPTYYWPLVVFLDESGCVLEGVSGFKSQKIPATLLQHAALQGVLKIPPNSHYMMITPLASAVDVPEQELSNQGQIKITALQ